MLSNEIKSALEVQGVPSAVSVEVLDCGAVLPFLQKVVNASQMNVHDSASEVIRAVRAQHPCVVLAGVSAATELLSALSAQNVTVGVIVVAPENDPQQFGALRALGAMDVCVGIDEVQLQALVQRGLDYRALLALELAHRCESRRLFNRELELLGQPPEHMSDDLMTFQPPPLPVGPTSIYDLDEASDAFERSYIDRVQQLCGSAREAAAYLGVSSATLSRRLRREDGLNG